MNIRSVKSLNCHHGNVLDIKYMIHSQISALQLPHHSRRYIWQPGSWVQLLSVWTNNRKMGNKCTDVKADFILFLRISQFFPRVSMCKTSAGLSHFPLHKQQLQHTAESCTVNKQKLEHNAIFRKKSVHINSKEKPHTVPRKDHMNQKNWLLGPCILCVLMLGTMMAFWKFSEISVWLRMEKSERVPKSFPIPDQTWRR